jgi:hypothetical protein
MLRDAKIGRFQKLAPNPPHEYEVLGPQNCTVDSQSGSVRLHSKRWIYAIRLTLRAEALDGETVTFIWRSDQHSDSVTWRVPPFWDEHVVWLDAPMDDFRLMTPPGASPITLGRVILMVPKTATASPNGEIGVP